MKLEAKTDFLLLGLLSHEPMTGYDIKKRIDTIVLIHPPQSRNPDVQVELRWDHCLSQKFTIILSVIFKKVLNVLYFVNTCNIIEYNFIYFNFSLYFFDLLWHNLCQAKAKLKESTLCLQNRIKKSTYSEPVKWHSNV